MDESVLMRLGAPTPPAMVEWKPQKIAKAQSRALMVAYVDARFVAERLDEAADGDWQFAWEPITISERSAVVKGRLTVCGVSREDAGEFVASGDEGGIMDVVKSAVSDALKRCGVLFGIGRDLYRIPPQWVNWDEARRAPAPGEIERLRALLGVPNEPVIATEDSTEVQHWIDSPEVRKRFWAYVGRLGLSHDEAHRALGVESVRDFGGTMAQAKALLDAYAANKTGGK